MPFKVVAMRTDQGSEFRGEFETTCQKLGLTLYIFAESRVNLTRTLNA